MDDFLEYIKRYHHLRRVRCQCRIRRVVPTPFARLLQHAPWHCHVGRTTGSHDGRQVAFLLGVIRIYISIFARWSSLSLQVVASEVNYSHEGTFFYPSGHSTIANMQHKRWFFFCDAVEQFSKTTEIWMKVMIMNQNCIYRWLRLWVMPAMEKPLLSFDWHIWVYSALSWLSYRGQYA